MVWRDDDFWDDDDDGWGLMNFGVWGGRCWPGTAPQGSWSPHHSHVPTCPCAGGGTDGGTGPCPTALAPGPGQTCSAPVGPPKGQARNHPSLALCLACHCHTATVSGFATPWTRVPWHCHSRGGTSMSILAPVVAPPRPPVPWCHHTHGGSSMAVCPLVSLHPQWHRQGRLSLGVTIPMVAACHDSLNLRGGRDGLFNPRVQKTNSKGLKFSSAASSSALY